MVVRALDWTADERAAYARDGFVVVRNLVDPSFCAALKARYPALFAGRFETGIEPEIVPALYREDDASANTRWMTNAWRGDHTAARLALDSGIGRAIATLNGWAGMRLLQDNAHWKPPGSPELSYHQDNSYHRWCDPAELSSCWVALGPVARETGTVGYVRGSHLWPRLDIKAYEDRVAERNLRGFLDPKDARAHVRVAAEHAGVEPEFVPIELEPGSAVFFNGWVWHGSFANTTASAHRHSFSVHGLRPECRFHPTDISPVWGRYKRFEETAMDEAVFPITWHSSGYRTPWLDAYVARGSGAASAA